jgi:hypothetical protein
MIFDWWAVTAKIKTVYSEQLDQVAIRIKHLVSTWPMSWGKHDAPGSIAVLTSYADQVIRLRTHLRYKGLGYVTVDRVLNVQGKSIASGL